MVELSCSGHSNPQRQAWMSLLSILPELTPRVPRRSDKPGWKEQSLESSVLPFHSWAVWGASPEHPCSRGGCGCPGACSASCPFHPSPALSSSFHSQQGDFWSQMWDGFLGRHRCKPCWLSQGKLSTASQGLHFGESPKVRA